LPSATHDAPLPIEAARAAIFETKLTPDEAEEYGLALILDAKRAKRHLETERWLRERR
jgi:hypothetical protein